MHKNIELRKKENFRVHPPPSLLRHDIDSFEMIYISISILDDGNVEPSRRTTIVYSFPMIFGMVGKSIRCI